MTTIEASSGIRIELITKDGRFPNKNYLITDQLGDMKLARAKSLRVNGSPFAPGDMTEFSSAQGTIRIHAPADCPDDINILLP